MLAGDTFGTEVRQDESRARALGANGVPFFVIDEAYGVSGAQPPEVLLGAMEQAWSETHPLTVIGATSPDADGAACTDDSCAI